MKFIATLLIAMASSFAIGQPLQLAPSLGSVPNINAVPPSSPRVEIARMMLGSGEPEHPGFENAALVENDMWHAPQYMPGWPTAATIWPRVVDVHCRRAADSLQCDGYNWMPEMGRGEYLYFRPIILAAVVSVDTPPAVIAVPQLPEPPSRSTAAGAPPPEIAPVPKKKPIRRKQDRE